MYIFVVFWWVGQSNNVFIKLFYSELLFAFTGVLFYYIDEVYFQI